MKPVNQTRLADDPKGGNCMAACIASILEISIEEVPDFDMRNDPGDWRIFWGPWLSEMGYHIFCMGLTAHIEETPLCIYYGLHIIMGGHTARDPDILHACVYKTDINDFEPVHDPHPSNDFITEFTNIYILIPKG